MASYTELECLAVPNGIDITPYTTKVKDDERIRTCVILGSFGKFHEQIIQIIGQFESAGIKVLAPKYSRIVDNQGFQLLETDTGVMEDLKQRYPGVPWTKDHFAAVIEKIFRNTIAQAGFVYIVDPSGVKTSDGNFYPSGYVGTMASGEIGCAMANKKPIYALEPLNAHLDEQEGIVWPPTFRGIAQTIKAYKPKDVAAMINGEGLDLKDYWWCEE